MLDYNYSVCEIVFAHSTIILWLYLFQILEFWIGDDQSMFQVLFKFLRCRYELLIVKAP